MIKKLAVNAPGNPNRSYRQKEFIISTFNLTGNSRVPMEHDAIEKAVKKLKGLGLNLIETAHSADDTAWYALDICEKEGIDVLFQNYFVFGGFQGRIRKETTREEIIKLIEKTKNYKHIKGYYVWDEPWEDCDLKATKEQTDWLDELVPGTHAFSVMVPNYNPDYHWGNGKYPEFVERYLDYVQPPVASFDYYPFGEGDTKEYDGTQLDNSNVWKDMGVVRRAALERNMPFWFYFQTLRTAQFPKYHFSMTRLQMNYALMYGVKGLQCYGLAGALVSPDKLNEARRVLELDYEEGCFYDDMRAMISITKNLGKTLMALSSDHVYHGKEVLPDDEYYNNNFREDIASDNIFNISELPFRCSIGILSDKYGNQYAAILNRDYLRAQAFSLPLKNNSRIYEVSKADGKHYCINNNTNCINVTLEAGDMAIYRIQNANEEAFDIEYVIE